MIRLASEQGRRVTDLSDLQAMASLACDATGSVGAALIVLRDGHLQMISHFPAAYQPIPVDDILTSVRECTANDPEPTTILHLEGWSFFGTADGAGDALILAVMEPNSAALLEKLHHAVSATLRHSAGAMLRVKAQTVLSNIEEMAGIGIWDASLASGAMSCSPIVYQLAGIDAQHDALSLDDLVGFFRADVRALVRKSIANAIQNGTGCSLTLPFQRADGRECVMRLVGHVEGTGDEARMFGIMQDVTQEKEAEKRLWWTANHDPLTHLPNRMLFQERLASALMSAGNSGASAGLILVDVDNFKSINDVYGHEAGDDLLRLVAARLGACTRVGDTLARLGGDEFAIIVTDLPTELEINVIFGRLIEAATIDFSYRGVSIPVKLSFGAAVFPKDARDGAELYRNADLAMFSAKPDPHVRGLVYQPRLGAEQDGREAQLQRIRAAVANSAVEPFIMPVVDLNTGATTSFDVLPFWRDGETVHNETALAPALDDTELAPDIGITSIERLAEILGSMTAAQETAMSVSVAVSPRQLLNLRFTAALLELLDTFGGIGGRYRFQLLTETLPFERDLPQGAQVVDRLIAQGLGLSMNNFAFGLVALLERSLCPVREIKFPKAVILEADRQERTGPLLRGAASACRRLGVEMVVTGISSQCEVDALRAMGYTRGQGPLLSRALELHHLPVLLSSPPSSPLMGAEVSPN